MIIQLTGMSGAGKTSLSISTKKILLDRGIKVEVLDADDYRQNVFKELGYTKEDRNDNIRRLAFVANKFSQQGIVAIICAINPYDAIRNELLEKYSELYTVYIQCDLETLTQRDTKGLYHKAMLPDGHKDKIYNLTGVNDPFEVPQVCHLTVETNKETLHESTQRLAQFIENNLK